MVEIKAPNKVPQSSGKPKLFLAGSIEMGKAEQWQDKVAKELSGLDLIILNPRREDWDSSWEQKIDNPQFREQVEWELSNIKSADMVVFYFDRATLSPITLLELGYTVNDAEGVFVCCPEGYWRKGNVDIVCAKHNVTTVDTLDGLIGAVKGYVKARYES